jgi:hypothetical protein
VNAFEADVRSEGALLASLLVAYGGAEAPPLEDARTLLRPDDTCSLLG